MNTKQSVFVAEYLRDFNATKAALRAGYSPKTAYSIGQELLKKPEIKDAVKSGIDDLTAGADEILVGLTEQSRSNIGEFFKVVEEWTAYPLPSYEIIDAQERIIDEETKEKRVFYWVRHVTIDLEKLMNPKYSGVVQEFSDSIKDGLSIKLYNKQTALMSLAKIKGMIVNKNEIFGKDGKPVQVEYVNTPYPTPGISSWSSDDSPKSKRLNVLDCGRRFGKDIIERNYASDGLLKGESIAWYEPEYKSLMDNWNWFTNTFYPLTHGKSEQEKRLDLTTGGFIEMWSLQDKDASRGRHYKRVVINEAAKIPHLEYSWNAVIRITLADLQGGAMIGSTPKGLNYFKSLYDRGADTLQGDWASFHKTTYDNPYILASEIEEIKASTPELIFQQEILAEFIDLQGSVFRRIQEAATLEAIDEPIQGRQYLAGVDVASAIDYTVVSVMDVQSKELVYLDRFNRVDYSTLEDRLAALHQRWKLSSMMIETNSIGQPVIDAMYSRGLPIQPFTTTSATKQQIITGLQSAFEHGEIHIINNPILIGELLSFESKRSPSGSFTYSAPDGMHDDTVMSLAIAWSALSAPPLFVGRY